MGVRFTLPVTLELTFIVDIFRRGPQVCGFTVPSAEEVERAVLEQHREAIMKALVERAKSGGGDV